MYPGLIFWWKQSRQCGPQQQWAGCGVGAESRGRQPRATTGDDSSPSGATEKPRSEGSHGADWGFHAAAGDGCGESGGGFGVRRPLRALKRAAVPSETNDHGGAGPRRPSGVSSGEPAHVNYAGLRTRIGDRTEPCLETGNGRRIDDRASPSRAHEGDRMLHAESRPPHQKIENPTPLLGVYRRQRPHAIGNPSVVEKDVEAAEGVPREGHDPGEIGLARYIAVGVEELVAKALLKLGRLVVLNVGHDDICALRHKEFDGAEPDPGGSARDDSDLTRQPVAHIPLPLGFG